MPEFNSHEAEVLRLAVSHFQNWLIDNVWIPIKQETGLIPNELNEIIKELRKLQELFSPTHRQVTDLRTLEILKRSILHKRREIAFDIEKKSRFTYHHELQTKLKDRLEPLSDIMEQSWFKETNTFKPPKIINYLSIKRAEKLLKENIFPDREHDEKFHILNAPTLFIPDLHYFRESCELRGKPLCVAYMDIDDFKKFNEEYTEPRVDRDVLPRFMSALEAHVFFHGLAYREGGDEYIVLLPNMNAENGKSFLNIFQKELEELKYFEIEKRITLSIGIVEVDEDCMLTDREIKEKAALAKKTAKEEGKNRISTYIPQDAPDR